MYTNDIFQLNVLLMSVGFGALSAFIYDIFKVLHKAVFNLGRGLIIKDFSYCMVIALLWFLFLLSVNYGRIRVYLIIGAAAGFCCWYFSISPIFVRFIWYSIIKIKSIFFLLGTMILLPFRPLFCLSKFIFGKISKFLQNYYIKIKNKSKIDLKKIS